MYPDDHRGSISDPSGDTTVTFICPFLTVGLHDHPANNISHDKGISGEAPSSHNKVILTSKVEKLNHRSWDYISAWDSALCIS